MDTPENIEQLSEALQPPLWLLPSYFVFLTTIFTLPRTLTWKLLSAAGHVLFYRFMCRYSLGTFSNDYPFGSVPLPQVGVYLAFFLAAPEAADTQPPASILKRLSDSAAMLVNVRALKTPFEARRLTVHNESRWIFLPRQLFWMVVAYLVVDSNKAATDFLKRRGIFDPHLFFQQPRTLQVILSFYNMLAGYFGMCFIHCAFSLFAVSLHLSEPRDWPDIYGSIIKCHTLAGFWSTTWHQMLQPCVRRLATLTSRDFLKIPRRGLLDYPVQLFIAFGISGSLHALASFYASRHGRANEIASHVWQTDFLFFSIQPIGILLEQAVIRFLRRQGRPSTAIATNLVGKIWVIAWFSCTLPILVGNHAIAGLWDGRASDGPASRLLGKI